MRVDPAILEPRAVSASALSSLVLLTAIVLSAGVASLRGSAPPPTQLLRTEESGSLGAAKVLGMKDRFASVEVSLNGQRHRLGDRLVLFLVAADGQRIPIVEGAIVERVLPHGAQILVPPVDALFLREASRIAPLVSEASGEATPGYSGAIVRDLFRLRALVAPEKSTAVEPAIPSAELPVEKEDAAPAPDLVGQGAEVAPALEAVRVPPPANAPSIVWLSGTGKGYLIGEDGSITPADAPTDSGT